VLVREKERTQSSRSSFNHPNDPNTPNNPQESTPTGSLDPILQPSSGTDSPDSPDSPIIALKALNPPIVTPIHDLNLHVTLRTIMMKQLCLFGFVLFLALCVSIYIHIYVCMFTSPYLSWLL